MSIDIKKLVCQPGGNKSSATLSAELLEGFLDIGVIQPENLLENTDGWPLWVHWIKDNQATLKATSLLMDVLPKIKGFSWAMRFDDNTSAFKAPLDVIGQYLSVEQLNHVIASLSDAEMLEVQNYPLATSRTFGLKKMVHHDRADLLDVLVSAGWSIDIQNDSGRSLLMECSSWKQAQLVLKHKPNVEVVDHANANILDCVRVWSHGHDFKEILTEVNSHRVHTPSTEFEVAEQKLFEIIASQKVAELKKGLKSLTLLPSEKMLQDSQGRSPLLVVCENMRVPRNQNAHAAYARFFIRFLNAFVPELDNHANFGKDRPLQTVSNWSEYDHTMMTLVVNSTHTHNWFPSELISQDLNKRLTSWSKNRLPQLASTLDAWVKLYLNDFMVTRRTDEKNNKQNNAYAALNLCAPLASGKLSHNHVAMFNQLARSDNKSDVFHHLLDEWIEQGNSSTPHHYENLIFKNEGIGMFACLWAVNNNVEPHSQMEKALVAFVWEYLCKAMISYTYVAQKNTDSAIFLFMDEKLIECTKNQPELGEVCLNKMNQHLENAQKYCGVEGQTMVERIRAFTEKTILLKEMPSTGEKSCSRKM